MSQITVRSIRHCFTVSNTYWISSVIVTSGPSSTYPKRAYRNPTDALVKFLDSKHGADWAIWEFRAEGTGYPDAEVYGRIRHYPWPDHHPPPFALIPNMMASMRDWLKGPGGAKERVIVVHCKAGKGRSGTAACSYLISEEGWKMDDALLRFTERRMRSGFGAGVSIPSQLRYVGYVERWSKQKKLYIERQIEVVEIHVWGLRPGVKVGINGYVDEGRTIKTFHTFSKNERFVTDSQIHTNGTLVNFAASSGEKETRTPDELPRASTVAPLNGISHASVSLSSVVEHADSEVGGGAVILRPKSSVILPSSDIDIEFERRNKAYGWTMVTSVAHTWFNAFFEGGGPENGGNPLSDGVFEIEWEDMDGIKGTPRKGIRALDRIAVIWQAADFKTGALARLITQPQVGEPIRQTHAADWNGANLNSQTTVEKDLGFRTESPVSASNSKASSLVSASSNKPEDDFAFGVRSHRLQGEEQILYPVGNKHQHSVITSKPNLVDPPKDAHGARLEEPAGGSDQLV